MKSFKFSNYCLALILALIFSPLTAQIQYEKANSAESMANEKTKYEVKKLELDAKEAKSLGQINLMYAKQMQELKRKTSLNNKSEVEALKRSHSQKIKSLLSSEKYRKYLELNKEKGKEQKKDEY